VGEPIDIAALVGQGVAVVVATRDGELRPEVGRAWGPSLSEDGARLSVCVEGGPDSAMARNLEAGSPVAAMITRLAAVTSVQLKGRVVEVAAPTQDRLDTVADHVDRFVAETGMLGVSEATARAFVGPELLAVTMEVTERFDETPGAGAGRAL
jgi:hypothetical protein